MVFEMLNRIMDVVFGIAMSKTTSAIVNGQSADYELGYRLGRMGFEVSKLEGEKVVLVYECKTLFSLKVELSCFDISHRYNGCDEISCFASVKGYSSTAGGFEHSLNYNADMLLCEVPRTVSMLRRLI